ncbi:uncharacterized protein [Lepeophtheirus salmonis]|uniref:uncharacterized protein n=1 Tax=Lepeophtheirus salmonis TaxID=72036 RepID=UPI003AF3D1B8
MNGPFYILATILLIVNGQPKTKNRDGLRKAKTYSSIFSAMADMSKIQAQRRSEVREQKEIKFITTGTPLYNNENSYKSTARFVKTTFAPFIGKQIRRVSNSYPLILSTPSPVPLRERLSSNREDDQKEVLSMEELNVLMDYMRELLKSNYKKSSYDRDSSKTDESIGMPYKFASTSYFIFPSRNWRQGNWKVEIQSSQPFTNKEKPSLSEDFESR